jgi:hypothetical protein
VQDANFSAAMKNRAFRAHVAVEHYVATHHPAVRHEGQAGAGHAKRPTDLPSRGVGSGASGIDRGGRGGSLGTLRGPAPGVR